MLKKERHDFVMPQINLHNRVLTSDLVKLPNVSEDTIRRNLQELAERGKLSKVHGGVLPKSYQSAFGDNIKRSRNYKFPLLFITDFSTGHFSAT